MVYLYKMTSDYIFVSGRCLGPWFVPFCFYLQILKNQTWRHQAWTQCSVLIHLSQNQRTFFLFTIELIVTIFHFMTFFWNTLKYLFKLIVKSNLTRIEDKAKPNRKSHRKWKRAFLGKHEQAEGLSSGMRKWAQDSCLLGTPAWIWSKRCLFFFPARREIEYVNVTRSAYAVKESVQVFFLLTRFSFESYEQFVRKSKKSKNDCF